MIPERVVELAAQEIDDIIGNALGVAENENMLDYPSVQEACIAAARGALEVAAPLLAVAAAEGVREANRKALREQIENPLTFGKASRERD